MCRHISNNFKHDHKIGINVNQNLLMKESKSSCLNPSNIISHPKFISAIELSKYKTS